MVLFWAFHGTDWDGFDGIGDGDEDRGGWLDYYTVNESRSTDGAQKGLGKGIYASTYYNKAKDYGEYVYLMGFEVSQIKVVAEWDNCTSWRSGQGQYYCDGAYMPASNTNCGYDEFCMRKQCLVELYLVRYEGGRQVYNWSFDKPYGLRTELENIMDCHGEPPYFLDKMKWKRSSLKYDISW